MKYILFFSFAFLPFMAISQIDIMDFEKFYLGGGYDKTNVIGLYAIQNQYTNEISTDLKDSRTTIMGELKGIVSTENYVSTGNFEGIIYFLARIASVNNGNALLDDFNTFLDPLTAGHCQNLELLYEDESTNEEAVFSNNHLLDLTTSWAFSNKHYLAGINLSMRTLGFPYRYTYYPTKKPTDRYVISTMGGSWKILYGINGGYRTNIGNKTALLFITGVNFGINKKDHNGENGNTNLSHAIQVKYSPFVSPTLFFGGKMGGYVSLYWEMMVARDNIVGYNPNITPGAPSDPLNPIHYYTKVAENQLQVKIGFYFPTWNN